ncbi:MAG: Re/Si-specific NAD(P)(+) transhydrogenase subunit alpha [Kiritimatiellae bacterium]|nr:Re/Si-specific NAD(P)(+) transhydrogenase subunit alpha [Kiritimatiellia bacterium]
MQIYVPKDSVTNEARVAIISSTVDKLRKLDAQWIIEKGLGQSIQQEDDAYIQAGAALSDDPDTSLGLADIILRLNPPSADEVKRLKEGCIHISYMDPFNQQDLVEAFAAAKVSAISMEMIPRTTLAQKMDALSSQANLAGYVAVIVATEHLNQILPMMMTPAGTLTPSRVFVIGAGVAGLQAIATAKRLGARVEAFDTRPVVKEQVQSLGAKFIKVDLGKTGQTKDGYAKELTEEQLQKQREAMTKACANADVVITTAQLFGRKAPLIINHEIIKQMKPGSIIVDLAVESGGNVEGSKLNEIVNVNGVSIIGFVNLPGRVPIHASQMYSSNLGNLVEHFWDQETKTFNVNIEDEIIQGCLITHNGEIVNERIRKEGH